VEYCIAVDGPPPARTLGWITAGAVALVGLVLLMTGILVVPGLLLVVVVFWSINRPRGVVVTSDGVALVRRSRLSNLPRPPVIMLPHNVFLAPSYKSGPWRGFLVGSKVVWMTNQWAAWAAQGSS
jgi:hypothetical protein